MITLNVNGQSTRAGRDQTRRHRSFTLPYLPHACMEVLNRTVRMTPPTGAPTACEAWAPTYPS